MPLRDGQWMGIFTVPWALATASNYRRPYSRSEFSSIRKKNVPVMASIRYDDASVREVPFRDLRLADFTWSVPWRSSRSVHGQTHHSGRYASTTMAGPVVYESRLELAPAALGRHGSCGTWNLRSAVPPDGPCRRMRASTCAGLPAGHGVRDGTRGQRQTRQLQFVRREVSPLTSVVGGVPAGRGTATGIVTLCDEESRSGGRAGRGSTRRVGRAVRGVDGPVRELLPSPGHPADLPEHGL